MDFQNGKFVNPRWETLDVIPETVQTNYYKIKYPEAYADYVEEVQPKPLPPVPE